MLWGLRQEGLEFPTNLGNIAKSISKSKARSYELPVSCGFLKTWPLQLQVTYECATFIWTISLEKQSCSVPTLIVDTYSCPQVLYWVVLGP